MKGFISWLVKSAIIGIVIVLAAISLFACQQTSGGSDFLGTWKDVRTSGITMGSIEITREGDKFLCTNLNGHTKIGIGTLKDGTIDFGSVKASYVKSSDTLIFGSEMLGTSEMKRFEPLIPSENQFVRKMPSEPMEDTIKKGDMLTINKNIGIPTYKDIVAYVGENPNALFIKRIVGIPGDTIQIINQSLLVNNIKIEEGYAVHKEKDIIPASVNPRDNYGPIKLGEGEYFVLGDNRDRSYDSRFTGPVKKDAIYGKVIKITPNNH